MVRFLLSKKNCKYKKTKENTKQKTFSYSTKHLVSYLYTHTYTDKNRQTRNETHTYTEQTKKIQEKSKYIRMTEQHIIQQHTNKTNTKHKK